ncbi:MAG TPA: hypothetical protein VF121_05875 [Thermoanaerobaculia bacterium]|nr:hypothetical protein [Thermoanaerobaculia bacterium]
MRRRPPALLLAALALAAVPLAATEVRVFQTQTQAGFLAGTLEGLSVDPLGRLELAHRAERLTALGEPFLLAAARHPDGWIVGTGNAGKVFLVGRGGEVRELFAAPEPEVFAVWADPDGTVFAGTSPGGKVYRIPSQPAGAKGELFFASGEVYVWSLARAADGALLVATGTQGKLFRVGPEGRGELLHDSEDTHVRTLEPLADGSVLAGTAGEGLVLRIDARGAKEPAAGSQQLQVRTLHDAAQPEVVALAAAPDGTVYAGLVASEASLVDSARGPSPPIPSEAPVAGSPEAQNAAAVIVSEGEAAAAASGMRKPDDKGPRSELVRISPAGLVESLWEFRDETVYDLHWQGDRLWVATGLEGKLYSFDGSQMLLEKDVDERQVVALVGGAPGDPGPAFATTNAAAFYRLTAATEKTGTYTSGALDAGQVARFGSFRWRGEAPPGSGVRFAFRSGVSSEPDRTWSAWTEPREGKEVTLAGVPAGRYVQWRADFRAVQGVSKLADGASPRLYGVELSYRQENLSPKIDSLTALDPGQILVPSNFNPSNQVFEPAHPNREGIFTTLEESGREEDGRLKPLWKKGYRSLRWRAADPNGDELVYELSFRPLDAGGAAAGEGWLPVAPELDEDWYSFDATVLPDGVYRFRLVASDRPSNEPDEAKTAERLSEPVVIDHSGPQLGAVDQGGSLQVTVTDELSPLREAVWSVDAGEWKTAEPEDGLLDGRSEVLHLDVPPGSRLVLLRVTDAAYNVVTFDLSREAR